MIDEPGVVPPADTESGQSLEQSQMSSPFDVDLSYLEGFVESGSYNAIGGKQYGTKIDFNLESGLGFRGGSTLSRIFYLASNLYRELMRNRFAKSEHDRDL